MTFADTWCSSCGASQGPGDEGVSSCAEHRIPVTCRGCNDWDATINGLCVSCHDEQARAMRRFDIEEGCGDYERDCAIDRDLERAS